MTPKEQAEQVALEVLDSLKKLIAECNSANQPTSETKDLFLSLVGYFNGEEKAKQKQQEKARAAANHQQLDATTLFRPPTGRQSGA